MFNLVIPVSGGTLRRDLELWTPYMIASQRWESSPFYSALIYGRDQGYDPGKIGL